eukprot:6208256-Pleurochrysis_carterae.AAC.3
MYICVRVSLCGSILLFPSTPSPQLQSRGAGILRGAQAAAHAAGGDAQAQRAAPRRRHRMARQPVPALQGPIRAALAHLPAGRPIRQRRRLLRAERRGGRRGGMGARLAQQLSARKAEQLFG